jgi:hypothetical protein
MPKHFEDTKAPNWGNRLPTQHRLHQASAKPLSAEQLGLASVKCRQRIVAIVTRTCRGRNAGKKGQGEKE